MASYSLLDSVGNRVLQTFSVCYVLVSIGWLPWYCVVHSHLWISGILSGAASHATSNVIRCPYPIPTALGRPRTNARASGQLYRVAQYGRNRYHVARPVALFDLTVHEHASLSGRTSAFPPRTTAKYYQAGLFASLLCRYPIDVRMVGGLFCFALMPALLRTVLGHGTARAPVRCFRPPGSRSERLPLRRSSTRPLRSEYGVRDGRWVDRVGPFTHLRIPSESSFPQRHHHRRTSLHSLAASSVGRFLFR